MLDSLVEIGDIAARVAAGLVLEGAAQRQRQLRAAMTVLGDAVAGRNLEEP